MKQFSLSPNMLNFSGVFYPTGYIFVMFPSCDDAEKVALTLLEGGFDENETLFLKPQTILEEINNAAAAGNDILPSVGSEAATARKYAEFARQGHCALMIHAPSDEEGAHVMNVVRRVPFSFAQKYHTLAIEGLH